MGDRLDWPSTALRPGDGGGIEISMGRETLERREDFLLMISSSGYTDIRERNVSPLLFLAAALAAGDAAEGGGGSSLRNSYSRSLPLEGLASTESADFSSFLSIGDGSGGGSLGVYV